MRGDINEKFSVSGVISNRKSVSGNIMFTLLKGLSAYEIAVKNGYVGTEEEWLNSLVGDSVTITVLEDSKDTYILSLQVGDKEPIITPNLKPVLKKGIDYLTPEEVEELVEEVTFAVEEQIQDWIPSKLSELEEDETHRTVTDEEKLTWNAKAEKEDIPNVPDWALAETKPEYTAEEVGALPEDTEIPASLSELTDDATHRLVTDAEKTAWNAKAETADIPTEETVAEWGFTKNKGDYIKPSTGIPKTDLAADVQNSLSKADTALQSFTEEDPTVPAHVKAITEADISKWNDTPDDVYTKTETDQKIIDTAKDGVIGDSTIEEEISKIKTDYALVSEAGYDLGLSIDPVTYVMTLELKNKAGVVITTKTVDFPIESMVIGATYADGKITLELQNGQTLEVDISSIVGGLVNDTFTIAGIDMKDNITAAELKTALGVPTKASDIGALPVDGTAKNAEKVNGHTVEIDVPADAKFTDTLTPVIDNLTSDSTTSALSAKQGKVLNGEIADVNHALENAVYISDDSTIELAEQNVYIQPVIYSEEEREIGVWTDGKPVYEKIIVIDKTKLSSYTQRSYAHGILNIDEIVSYKGNIITTDGIIVNIMDPISLDTDSSYVSGKYTAYFRGVSKTDILFNIGSGRFDGVKNIRVIIRYTKTTDVPGSGTWTPSGAPAVHYDDKERVIGTWFGKTLYQKTFKFQSPGGTEDKSTLITDELKNGVNCHIVSIEGFQTYGYLIDSQYTTNLYSDAEPLSQTTLHLSYYGGSTGEGCQINCNRDGIWFHKLMSATEANAIVFTLKYIKR